MGFFKKLWKKIRPKHVTKSEKKTVIENRNNEQNSKPTTSKPVLTSSPSSASFVASGSTRSLNKAIHENAPEAGPNITADETEFTRDHQHIFDDKENSRFSSNLKSIGSSSPQQAFKRKSSKSGSFRYFAVTPSDPRHRKRHTEDAPIIVQERSFGARLESAIKRQERKDQRISLLRQPPLESINLKGEIASIEEIKDDVRTKLVFG